MDQLLLFSDQVVLVNRWRTCLSQADLAGATAVLQERLTVFPRPDGGQGQGAGLAALGEVLELPDAARSERLAELVGSWRHEPRLGGLLPDAQALEAGLWAALSRVLPARRTAPFRTGLWPAEVWVRVEDWPTAARLLPASIVEHGEVAFLRQLQAWVMVRQGRLGPARATLALALCNAAGECRAEYLYEDLSALLAEARKQLGDSPAGWQWLTFNAWRQGLLDIPATPSPYELWLLEQTRRAPEPHDPAARGQHFLRLLFLAEAARARGEPIGRQIELRGQMQALQPERFQEYMAEVERR